MLREKQAVVTIPLKYSLGIGNPVDVEIKYIPIIVRKAVEPRGHEDIYADVITDVEITEFRLSDSPCGEGWKKASRFPLMTRLIKDLLTEKLDLEVPHSRALGA